MSAAAVRGPVIPAGSTRAVTGDGDSAWLRLVAFFGLASFAAAQWATLVSGAPTGRIVAAIGVAIATGAVLIVLGVSSLPRRAVQGLAALTVLVGLLAGLLAAGLPAGLVPPWHWGELHAHVDHGIGGIGATTWPYDGPDDWVRLVLLLAVPAALTTASALAFWPARPETGTGLRAGALVVLLVLYAVPATDHDPGAPILHGAILLLLLAAWLWLPRMNRRDAVAGTVALLAVGVVAVPAATALDPQKPAIGYGHWGVFGGRSVTFDWNHSYGPLDWPRRGTTLLTVTSRRPFYWKAETLDLFDGLRWVRSRDNASTSAGGELPQQLPQQWVRRFEVKVNALSSNFVVTAGTPLLVTGAGAALSDSADGTLRASEGPLGRGERYTVNAYVPEPTPAEMRDAPPLYYGGFAGYTRIGMPRAGETALSDRRPGEQVVGDRQEVNMPLRGDDQPGAQALAAERLRDSPYRRAYALSQRLTAAAPSTYDAVANVRSYLSDNYTYSERPPTEPYPLESFLFEDRIGYCQQFSGAMALLLRMAGIPARVVGGFAPGERDPRSNRFQVRDLDAHSWVEVYFNDIGWVTFDPTPAGPPAQREGPAAPAAAAGAANSADRSTRPDASAQGGGGGGAASDPAGGGVQTWMLVLAGIGLGALGAGVAAYRSVRGRRNLGSAELADAGLRELERALPRLGLELRPGTTLLALEQRLNRVAGPDAGGYVRSLRRSRFAAGGTGAPRFAGRHALRRGLTATRGPLVWLHGLVLLPPWGPRTTRRSL